MTTQVQETLQVQWNGGGLTASPERAPILVGRSADADVHIDGQGVSRKHLRLILEEGGWFAVDESSGGTYSPSGVRIERVPLGPEEVTLHLGSPGGPAVRLITAEPVSGGGPGSMPHVPPIDVGAAWTVATNDPTLRLEIDGRDYAFAPPARVVVGRDPRCAVVSDNGLVSRQHLAFTSRGTGWFIEDLGSSRGTFVDGKRLRKPTRAQGAFIAMLGDEEAGERLQVVTAGTHKKPRKRSRLATTLKVLPVVAVMGLGIALLARPDPEPEPDDPDPSPAAEVANTPEQLDSAARATVRITLLDQDDEIMGMGSGAVVSSDGLILTNAHVADPSQRGHSQDQVPESPAGYGIYVVSDRSSDAQERYRAELVAMHPTVDAALLRIVSNETGQPAGEIATPVMPVGDSNQLVNGDQAHQLGFPGLARTWEVSVAAVTIQSFSPLMPCSELPAELENLSCSAEGRVQGGLMNLSGGDLGQGSSGGPFVREGELVGINVGALSEEISVQSYGIPVQTIHDWLTDNGVPT